MEVFHLVVYVDDAPMLKSNKVQISLWHGLSNVLCRITRRSIYFFVVYYFLIHRAGFTLIIFQCLHEVQILFSQAQKLEYLEVYLSNNIRWSHDISLFLAKFVSFLFLCYALDLIQVLNISLNVSYCIVSYSISFIVTIYCSLVSFQKTEQLNRTCPNKLLPIVCFFYLCCMTFLLITMWLRVSASQKI